MGGGIFGERLGAHRREQMFPDEIELALHARALAGDRDDRVLLREHDGELSERAVAAERLVLAAPELIAISLEPVILRVGAGRLGGRRLLDLEGGGFLDPFRGQNFAAFPGAFLQIELAEFREIFGAHAQPPAAGIDAARTRLPGGAFDAERFKHARLEAVQRGLPGDLLDDRREHVGGGAIVEEMAAGSVGNGPREEGFHPVLLLHHRARGLLRVADGHREQIPHAQGRQIFTDGIGKFLRKKRNHFVIHPQFPIRHRQPHGGGRETFAHRIQRVNQVGTVRRPPAFRDHAPVAQHHHAMELVLALGDGLEEGQNARGRNALRFRRAAREPGRRRAVGKNGAGEREREAQSAHPEAELFEEGSAIRCHAPRILRDGSKGKPDAFSMRFRSEFRRSETNRQRRQFIPQNFVAGRWIADTLCPSQTHGPLAQLAEQATLNR